MRCIKMYMNIIDMLLPIFICCHFDIIFICNHSFYLLTMHVLNIYIFYRSGKSPAYRQQIKKNTEQKDTKYDKILERANQFVKDTRNNDDNNIKKTYNLNSENNNADKPSQEENNDYYNDNNSTFITEQNEDNYENSFDTTDNDNYDNNQYFYSTNENNDFEKSDHNYKDGSECNSGNRTDSLYAKYHRQQLLSKQAKESREKLKELPAPVEGLSRNRTYRDASYPPPVPHLPQSPQSSINYNYPNAANANEYTDAGSHSSNPSHYKVAFITCYSNLI